MLRHCIRLGWGLVNVSSLAGCLGEGRGKKTVPGFSDTKEERREAWVG